LIELIPIKNYIVLKTTTVKANKWRVAESSNPTKIHATFEAFFSPSSFSKDFKKENLRTLNPKPYPQIGMSRASEHTHLQRIINLILLLAGNV
jgi:hypothetical protein